MAASPLRSTNTLRSCSRLVRLVQELRAKSHKQDLACCLWVHSWLRSHGAGEPRGITRLRQIHPDLQRHQECRVHQLTMRAFVSGAPSWDVGIFKWVNNEVRLYLCTLCKSLNARYRLSSWLAFSRRFLPSLKYFFSTCSAFFSSQATKPPFLAKKYMH